MLLFYRYTACKGAITQSIIISFGSGWTKGPNLHMLFWNLIHSFQVETERDGEGGGNVMSCYQADDSMKQEVNVKVLEKWET